MTTLAAAGKQLEEINKKKSILPKKVTKVEKATLAKINEVKKQINLNKQSNADIFSQDSGSCSSEEEDDFIDRDCEEEKHGPLAHLSSSSSGFSLEEEDDDDNGSMTLSSESEEKEKEKPWRAAGKRPRSLEEIRAATQSVESKKRKIDVNTEQDEKLRRMEQLSITLKANIREYERLRQVTSNAIQQVEEALVQLEAKEKSCEKATLFVINQDQVKKDDEALKKREQKLKEADEALQKREQTLFERVEGLDQRDTQMRNETKEMTERLNQKTEELAQREKTIAVNQEIAVNQFKEESDRKLKELDQKAAELEKREKVLQQQPQQQPKLSILEGFRAEMHKTQQNTLTKEMLMNIMPPVLMSNITTLTLRANTPIYKTYSMSNGKYILLDIENAEGMPLLSQVIAKDLYNVK